MSFAQIKPIIKKNLIIVKRNSFKNILQLFYPSIILIFFISILQHDKIKPKPEKDYHNYESNYSFKSLVERKYPQNTYGLIAIVGNNNTDSVVNLEDLKKFIENEYCLPKPNEIFNEGEYSTNNNDDEVLAKTLLGNLFNNSISNENANVPNIDDLKKDLINNLNSKNLNFKDFIDSNSAALKSFGSTNHDNNIFNTSNLNLISLAANKKNFNFDKIDFNQLAKILQIVNNISNTSQASTQTLSLSRDELSKMLNDAVSSLNIIGLNAPIKNVDLNENPYCTILTFENWEKYSDYLHSQTFNETNNPMGFLIEFKKTEGEISNNSNNNKDKLRKLGDKRSMLELMEENFAFKISSLDLARDFRSEYDNLDSFKINPDYVDYQVFDKNTIVRISLALRYLLNKKKLQADKDLQLTTMPMKTPEFVSTIDLPKEANMAIPVTLCISYISILFQFVLWMVVEKEEKLKDLFLRQGVSINVYFLSWFITFIILTLPTITINSILLKLYLFTKSSIFIIFLNLFLFSINILSMALVFHQFASDVRTGQSLLKFLYIGVSILSVPISQNGTPVILRIIFSIFPQTILRMSFDILTSSKDFPNGLDVNVLFMNYKGLSMLYVLVAYIVVFIVYVVFAFFLQSYFNSGLPLLRYLKRSFSGLDKNIRINPNFQPCELNINERKSDIKSNEDNNMLDNLLSLNEKNLKYNKNNSNNNYSDSPNTNADRDDNNEQINILNNNNNEDNDSIGFDTNREAIINSNLLLQEKKNEILMLQNINKFYDDLHVVKNFSCKLYKGQIFCLLGHNGAGKTTLIKILSGMEDIYIPSSSSSSNKAIGIKTNAKIFFEHENLIDNREYLFNILGLCSQDDIIFQDLTVQEHLEIMSELKSKSQIDYSEINNLLVKLDLREKQFSIAKTLSGGQKRKLCIAMALIGNSKIILLDEPTSGMDVQAKRNLWDFLANYKTDKIIILTTHSLDEAEFLGDRIGIMSEGKLICEGSSSYLKNQYSCGFNLNLLLDEEKITNQKRSKLILLLKKFDDKIGVKALGKELMILNFPTIKENCEKLFEKIEEIKHEMGIINYTLMTTSLEDVFIKLNEGEDSKHMFENQLNLQEEIFDDNDEEKNEAENFIDSNCLLNANNMKSKSPKLSNEDNKDIIQISDYKKDNSINRDEGSKNYHRKEEKKNKNGINDSYKNIDNSKAQLDVTKNSSICSQLGANVKRHLISLWRNKKGFLLELIACSVTFFVYTLFLDALMSSDQQNFRMNMLLTNSKIYYFVDPALKAENFQANKYFKVDEAHLWGSQFYDSGKKINFVNWETENNNNKPIPSSMNTILQFDDFIFQQFTYHNLKAALYIKKGSSVDSKLEIYALYNAAARDYSYALKNWIFSSFIKNEYQINSDLITNFGVVDQGIKNGEKFKELFLIIFSIFLMLSCFINLSGFMILIPLKERINNVKHLQFLSGMNMFIYWISILIVDFIKFGFLIIMIYPFLIYRYHYLIWSLPIIIFFIISSCLVNYILSHLFETENSGQKFSLLIIYLLFIILLVIDLVNNFIDFDLEKFDENKEIYRVYFSDFFPSSELGLSLLLLILKISYGFFTEHLEIKLQIIRSCIVFSLQSLLWGIILVCLHYSIFEKIYNILLKKSLSDISDEKRAENEFTKAEKSKVLDSDRNNLTFKIINLTKTFVGFCCCSKKNAVNHQYLGLKKNEKFGLLGFNGSGKTTTFRSITNEIIYETGEIKILDYDSKKDFQKIRKSIGYCPQNNALFDHLTVEETFDYYLRLKVLKYYDEDSSKKDIINTLNLTQNKNFNKSNNVSKENNTILEVISPNQQDELIESKNFKKNNLSSQKIYLMKKFGLDKFRNTYSKNLSGGNKRKLNFAIALMHNPNLILLDEPSTGVDPESRRIMWKNINEIPLHSKNFNMILSTHSMEEAEILCDTIGWMKDGNFLCIGNPEKLKIKYSPEYYINLKIKLPEDEHEKILDSNNNDKVEYNVKLADSFYNLNSEKNFICNFDLRSIITTTNTSVFEALLNIILKIGSYCEKIQLIHIYENNSFKIGIKFREANQIKVFNLVLNMKMHESSISEINVGMKKLEDIFDKF